MGVCVVLGSGGGGEETKVPGPKGLYFSKYVLKGQRL